MLGKECYQQGVAAYRGGSFETAIAFYDEAINLNDEQATYYDARASAHLAIGRYAAAFKDCKRVVDLMPESHRGFLKGGKVQLEAGNLEKAEKLFKAALDRTEDAKVIEQIRVQLDLVEEQRQKLEVLSPIHRLPYELLIHIISIATEDYRNALITIGMKRYTPIYPSHVCRNWYTMIHNCSTLWSTLHLDGNVISTWPRKWAFFGARALGKVVGTAKGITAVEPVAPVSARQLGFKLLSISEGFASLQFERALDQLVRTEFLSNLAILYFVEGTGDSMLSIALSTLVTKAYNTLHTIDITVDVRGPPLSMTLRELSLALPQLRHFRIECGSRSADVSCNLDVIGGSSAGRSKLKRLQLNLARIPWKLGQYEAVGPYQVEEFPELEHIDLSFEAWVEHRHFLPLLTIPNLRTFHIDNFGNFPQPVDQPAFAFVASIQLTRSARLVTHYLNRAVQLATSFPHLVNLDLTGAKLSSDQLYLFNSTNAPHLAHLILRNTLSTSTTTRFLDLPHFIALKSLDVSNTSWFNNSNMESLIRKAPALERFKVMGNDDLTGTPLMKFVASRSPVVENETGAPGWFCSSNSSFSPQIESKEEVEKRKGKEKFISGVVELDIMICPHIEKEAVDWLKLHIKRGGVKHAFVF